MEANNDVNNGLITKIWGSPGWIFCHSVTFGYPINPTQQQKDYYRQFFMMLGNVLPCRFCRDSYNDYITREGTSLTDSALQDRASLTKWFYNIHEAVNKKLGVEYCVTYENMVNRYESFRAKCGKNDEIKKGCITPLNYKAYSFKKLNEIDCPIIQKKIVDKFVDIAKARKISEKYFNLYRYISDNNVNIKDLQESCLWEYRNKICRNIINRMRENGISSIEQTGIWQGCPTVSELKLILFFCSNLNKYELNEIK